MDKYSSYALLSKNEVQGKDYDLFCVNRETKIVIMAPHGGEIDYGTSEIAEALSENDYSVYLFIGKKRSRNKDLHLASERFDEPEAITLLSSAETVLTVHGCDRKEDIIYVGGLNDAFKEALTEALNDQGFPATMDTLPRLSGTNPDNICNRGRSGKGVQLEISKGLRKKMFGYLYSRSGRQTKTSTFHALIAAVRSALQDLGT